ncbi:hypothetical protein ACFLIM_41505 [Nonomuraea sp. M3C6]|uniref:DUF2147 domain-containing protein n=1 Tax=Nonomuraea marmarensis TaxID=3351344 RepID=A0ABW7ARK3_9ACTN
MAKPFSRRTSLLVVAGIVAAALGLPYLGQMVFEPWARSPSGAPTLTGYWAGTVTFPGKGRVRVAMELYAPIHARRCGNCPEVKGDLKVCASGHPVGYEVWGHVSDRRASSFSLLGRTSGASLGGLEGWWQGGDTLTVSLTDQAPGRWQLHRATESIFTDAC